MTDAPVPRSSSGTDGLLPCPMCGADDLMRGECFTQGSIEKEAAVRCAKCTCRASLIDWQARGVAQGSADRGALTKIAAECHRAKWEFDISGEETPLKAAAARELVDKAFRALHRIGDIALKLRAESAASPPAALPAGTWRGAVVVSSTEGKSDV